MRGRNKSDVKEEEKVVSYADGERFAKENGLLFMETSAKTGYNVDKIFMDRRVRSSAESSPGRWRWGRRTE